MFISSLTFLRLSFLPVRASFIACPKAAKSYKGTGLFAIIIGSSTFFCLPFLLNVSIQFYLVAKIVLISAILYYALTKEQMNAL